MTSRRCAALISGSHRRVVLVAPSISCDVGDAIKSAAARLGPDQVRVVLDCDEDTFRLGYGDVIAVRKLVEAQLDIRHCPGVRSGLLIVDDRAWAFTPTALFVQVDAHSDETPNAIGLTGSDVERIVTALSPTPKPDCESLAEPQIGQTPLDATTVKAAEEALEQAPPIPFDVARQVRVFQPYIQYVEMSLRGCHIERHRVTIPKKILGVGAGKEIEGRLRTTFELVERNSELGSQALEDELRKIRESLTRSLGKPWGRVLLRSTRPLFDERIEAFRMRLEEHKKALLAELHKKLADSRNQVIEYYLPTVKNNPPDELRAQLMTARLSDEHVRSWLDDELDREFPSADQIMTDMEFDVQFRDVTYETLNQDGFAKAIREAFPLVNWDKPFHEFKAAKEGDPGRSP